jgi:hypothetical protein
MRRHSIRLIAFTVALTTGIAISAGWQNIFLKVSNRHFLSPRHVADVSGTCEVHGEHMGRKYVSVLSGLPGYPLNDKGYLEAKSRLFPNSNLFIIDRGRAVTEGHAEVNFCLKCRLAERQWMENR